MQMIETPCRGNSFLRCTGADLTLPFAFAAMATAARHDRGWPGWRTFMLILAAIVCAHAFYLGFGLLAGKRFGGLGQRTARHNFGDAQLRVGFAVALCLLSGAGLVLASNFLNRLCFYLSPAALVLICFSLLSRRFTNCTHFFVGLTVALAPVGAWLAVRGSNITLLELLQVSVLALAVVFWSAGFDIAYSTQAHVFDRPHALGSLAVVWGTANALMAAFIAHMLAAGLLLAFGLLCKFRIAYLVGWLIIVCCFVLEHWIARHRSLGWIGLSFPRLNAVASTVFLVVSVAEVVFAGGFRLQ